MMRKQRYLVMAALMIALASPTMAGNAVPGSEDAVNTTADDAPLEPVLLLIQGRLKPGGESAYGQYIKGTGPLMAEYGVTVDAVGVGFAGENTTEFWPVNAILRFPDEETAEAFLADPRYVEIKEKYRDAAYEELHLSFFTTRTPKIRTPKAVAEEAFADFRSGLATGRWQPFLDRLSDDFTFHFPLGAYQGLNHGKTRAGEFFAFVSQVYSDGLFVDEVLGVTAEGTRVVFEFSDHGLMFGKPYANQVAISLDVCGEQICAYREYFGLVGPPPEKKSEQGAGD
jgi:ketosteroid isomerase-like protein/uncharacterized protein (DUF1330 family)